jgi:hypothetical protein
MKGGAVKGFLLYVQNMSVWQGFRRAKPGNVGSISSVCVGDRNELPPGVVRSGAVAREPLWV